MGRAVGAGPWLKGRLFQEEQQSTGVHAQQPALSMQSIGCGAGEACCPELQPHLSGPVSLGWSVPSVLHSLSSSHSESGGEAGSFL